jgi:hypothetical protein
MLRIRRFDVVFRHNYVTPRIRADALIFYSMAEDIRRNGPVVLQGSFALRTDQ